LLEKNSKFAVYLPSCHLAGRLWAFANKSTVATKQSSRLERQPWPVEPPTKRIKPQRSKNWKILI